jgi:hypothetical protein
LTHRNTFKAFQIRNETKTKLTLAIPLAKVQEKNKGGLLMANTNKRASPSKERRLLPKEVAKRTATLS